MKTFLCTAPKFGLLFSVVCLSLQAAPVAAADAGSGTYVGSIGSQRVSLSFKDVYAFRAEDSGKKQVTMVILSESPMDKKAMTAALKKGRNVMALSSGPFFDKTAFVQLEIDQSGEVRDLYLFKPPGSNLNLSGIGKSTVKVNTAKRVEGQFSSADKNASGEARKFDLRFAADLADIGVPVEK